MANRCWRILQPEVYADLARLNAAWATLPSPIKTAIVALLDAASPTPQTFTKFATVSPVSRSYAENGQNYQPGEEDGTRRDDE